MWQPFGNVRWPPSKVPFSISPGSMPFGIFAGANASRATCVMSIDLSVPATVYLPSLNTMSCSPASIRCAAIFLPLSSIFLAAVMIAVPPATAEREPNVPVPMAIWSVSPHLKLMLLRIDAELFGDDLAERGLMALAVVVRADQHRDRAGRVEADFGVFDQADVG